MNSKAEALRKLLQEAAIVGVAGLSLALLANQISPRGLVLTRDYFGTTLKATSPDAHAAGPASAASIPVAGDARGPKPELSRDGFRTADFAEVRRWQDDPRREQGLIVFVDARDERHFREGHLPGAMPFDPFYPEQRLAEVLAACALADQVVIYCNGGECTDSYQAARLLRDAGIPVERLVVFTGGISAWKARRSPVEIGERNSGDLRTP